MEFVTIKGNRFFYKGKPVIFRGLGIGSWLNMEHFMLGIPTPEKQIREAFTECFGKEKSDSFFQDFISSFVGEDDFRLLKEMGVNLIRVPFNYHWFLDDENPAVFRQEGFCCFDRLLELCRKYEIFLLPDLHAVPGGQNPDWHSDNQTGVPQFWFFEAFQEQIAQMWHAIAKRYASEPFLLGYDLLNEPYLMPQKEGVLQKFYEKVTQAIRQADQNHIIFLEGDHFAMDFSAIHTLRDEQTAITFHFYPTVWEAELCDINYPAQKRREIFEKRFSEMISGMQKFGRPLLCGEAGYDIAGHELWHVMQMVEDTLTLFEKYGISWTLWCYKDACFMGVVYPQKDSPWMKFAEEIHIHWTHYREMEMGKALVEQMCRYFPGEVSEELKYQLQFRQRALLFTLQKEQILKPQLKRWGWERMRRLPASFRMENCGYYEEYGNLLKTFTGKKDADIAGTGCTKEKKQ